MNSTEAFKNAKEHLYKVISISESGLTLDLVYAHAFKILKDHDLCRKFLKHQGYKVKQIYNARYHFCKNKQF